MYDLEIACPADANVKHILDRFTDFKKWGFLNIGNTKIKLYLLASSDNNELLLISGWPEGVDVEVIITPYKHVAQRNYYYYHKIIKPDTANWYIRLDEDSMTDIGGLMKTLDKFFDPERDYHIAGTVHIESDETEMTVLKALGYSSWFTHESNYPPHEHEISITSNAAIKRIFSNRATQKYFKLRLEFASGPGDQGLCYCARMSKIHPYQSNFLTHEPNICQFSIFGGPYHHIHWISKDQNPCISNWMNSFDLSKLDVFKNKTFLMIEKNGNKKLIKMNENQTFNHGLWGVTKNEELSLFFHEFEKNTPTTIFKKIEEGEFISKNYKLIEVEN